MKSPWKLIGRMFRGSDRERDEKLADEPAPSAAASVLENADNPGATEDDRAEEHLPVLPSHLAPKSPPSRAANVSPDDDPGSARSGDVADVRTQGAASKALRTGRKPGRSKDTKGFDTIGVQTDRKTSAPSFETEVRDLEADIRVLKRQLREKLTLQNEQLRKMLERFERTWP